MIRTVNNDEFINDFDDRNIIKKIILSKPLSQFEANNLFEIQVLDKDNLNSFNYRYHTMYYEITFLKDKVEFMQKIYKIDDKETICVYDTPPLTLRGAKSSSKTIKQVIPYIALRPDDFNDNSQYIGVHSDEDGIIKKLNIIDLDKLKLTENYSITNIDINLYTMPGEWHENKDTDVVVYQKIPRSK